MPLALRFTANSTVAGGVPDFLCSSRNVWKFSINQKADKRIMQINLNYYFEMFQTSLNIQNGDVLDKTV